MWAPQNNKVINALLLTLFLSWLIHVSGDAFLKSPENFSGPQTNLWNWDPIALKGPT